MRNLFLLLLLPFLFLSCFNADPVTPQYRNETGSLTFKLDPSNTPSSVSLVVLTLSNYNFDDIISVMQITSESSAELKLNSIPTGKWNLKAEAKNLDGEVEYVGETEVVIEDNKITEVFLTLYSTNSGIGGIKIFVNWTVSKWVDYSGNPVLSKLDNPSNPLDVRISKVIFDDGKYKMWYTAVYNSGVNNIWYAESVDGINWTTIGTSPVLDKGFPGSWDSYGFSAGAVIKEGNNYKMYYIGTDNHPFSTSASVGLAESSDGITWTKFSNPVLTASNKYYRIGASSIVKQDSIYWMYFGYISIDNSNYRIGAAASLDGINWDYCNNPILTPSINWEGSGIYFPSVIFENNKFKMIYQNSGENAFGMASGVNGHTFVKDAFPIFTKEQSANGWDQIAYPNFNNFNNKYCIYYSGTNDLGEVFISLLQKP